MRYTTHNKKEGEMKAMITMSKGTNFSRTRAHEFVYDENTGTWRNPDDPSQGIDFLDKTGSHDELQWIVDDEDRRGVVRKCNFIGHEGGFEGLTKIEVIND
jgi:hypothetical protein